MRTHTAGLSGMVALAVGVAAAPASAMELAVPRQVSFAAASAAVLLAVLIGIVAALAWVRRRGRAPAADRDTAALQRDGERFAHALIEHTSDLISILNADGTVRFASASHERVMGWRPEELVGRNAFELIHPDDQADILAAFAEGMAAGGAPVSREFRFRHKDGSWRVVESVAKAALDDPVVSGAVINSRDVTARRQIEEALRDSTRSLELLLGQLPAVVWMVDRELRITAMSGAALRRLELDPQDAIGAAVAGYFGTGAAPPAPAAAHRQALNGMPQDYELTWLGRHFLNHLEPLRDASGEIVGVIGVGQDVTERRRAEGDKAALLDVAHDIAGRLELADVLACVSARLVAMVPCEGVAVLRYDATIDADRLIAHAGEPSWLAEAARDLT